LFPCPLIVALEMFLLYSTSLKRTFFKEILYMSNAQVRLLASAIALLAGGILATTDNIDVNVSIAIILISAIIFIVEYWRLQKP
jgi:hypothetical protein